MDRGSQRRVREAILSMMADPNANEHLIDNHHRGNKPVRFLANCVFATDHKIVGLQFLFSALIWSVPSGILALIIRWQIAWPSSDIPIVGVWLFPEYGGQMPPVFFYMLMSIHDTIMVYFVFIPILTLAFGHYLTPLMVGATRMAFPWLNMLSYWVMWPAFGCLILSFLIAIRGPDADWTRDSSLVVFDENMLPINGAVQQLCALSMVFVGISLVLWSINIITTILQMRAPGMHMFRLPMTIWGMLATAIAMAMAIPVILAVMLMHVSDHVLQTGFFNSNHNASAIPIAFIIILPVPGMACDIIACFSRKSPRYRAAVFSIFSIAALGLVALGLYLFMPVAARKEALSFFDKLLLLPSGVLLVCWIGTMWGGRLQLTTSMWFSIAFVLTFLIGVIASLAMSAVDATYYVAYAGCSMGIFGAIHFWFPKMFGHMMNETLGKLHFLLTFVLLNCSLIPTHVWGGSAWASQDINIFITYSAILLGAAQLLFAINFVASLFFGRRADDNPWQAMTLEWSISSPPAPGNFEVQPLVHRGPYEFGHLDKGLDFRPQNLPDSEQ